MYCFKFYYIFLEIGDSSNFNIDICLVNPIFLDNEKNICLFFVVASYMPQSKYLT